MLHGPVRSAEVISDRETGRSRGFGFVEMETAEGGQAAISALHNSDMGGRPLTVNEARERTPRGPGGGGGGGGGGRGGYGGRGGGGGGGGGRILTARNQDSLENLRKEAQRAPRAVW